MLKKEFKEKDVERIRNLVKGKSGERTMSGVGFAKKQQFHKEGDIWIEDGREWTIKEGLKQNITKLDKAKKIGKMPMFCPSCKSLMHKNRDQYLYPIHGKCLNSSWISYFNKSFILSLPYDLKCRFSLSYPEELSPSLFFLS